MYKDRADELDKALHEMKYNLEYDTVRLAGRGSLLYSSNMLGDSSSGVTPPPFSGDESVKEIEDDFFLLGVYYLYHAIEDKGLYTYG